MKALFAIYKILLDNLGYQNWWPITPEGELNPIYPKDIHSRQLSEKEMFEISLGAILTQNTSWKNVEKAIININKNNLASPEKILDTKTEFLAETIRSSGYFNQKAIKLKIFSEWLMKNYSGSMKRFFNSGNLEKLREELLSIKGIGPETADSILLYAGNKNIFVIDAYTKRIFLRIGINEQDYHKLQRTFMENLPSYSVVFKEYHALIVELGKNFCRKREPLCVGCPLKMKCVFGQEILSKTLNPICCSTAAWKKSKH